ncbi:MAG TPA: ATPase [Bacteroidia bacterium]|nr:ATPase [Bacteroidia bacterium]
MKVLIADSGSTKTEWTLLEDNMVVRSLYTEGINPNQANEEVIAKMLLKTELRSFAPTHIYFYGSGCGSASGKNIVRNALDALFTSAEITIESDLFAAARALCGSEKGIVAIMGTGSSSCLYDGLNIAEQRPSLGFILGDEGSGAVLGKMFVKKLLYGELPQTVTDKFYEEFPIDKEAIIARVYREPYPNRFLATFAGFIAQHKQHGPVNEIIRDNFNGFIRSHVSKYTDAKKFPVHFTGSIAHYFGEEMKGLLQWNGYTPGKIEQSPMEGLIRYHQANAR